MKSIFNPIKSASHAYRSKCFRSKFWGNLLRARQRAAIARLLSQSEGGNRSKFCHNLLRSIYFDMRETDPNERPYACTQCDYTCVEKSALNFHIMVKHPTDPHL